MPSREAWMRIYYLNLYIFDIVVTFDDSKEENYHQSLLSFFQKMI